MPNIPQNIHRIANTNIRQIIAIPQLLQGVLTLLSARKVISKNAYILFSKKQDAQKTTYVLNKCTNVITGGLSNDILYSYTQQQIDTGPY